MTLGETEMIPGMSQVVANYSYSVLGRPLINGTKFYEVGMTISALSSDNSGNVSMLMWFLPNGTATLVQMNGLNYTGADAELYGLEYTAPFILVSIEGQAFDQGLIDPSSYFELNSTIVQLGPTSVNLTDYQLTQAYLNQQSSCGVDYNALIIGLGSIQGVDFRLGIMTYESISMEGTSLVVYFQVTSLTKAS